jgi:hypothetical protein
MKRKLSLRILLLIVMCSSLVFIYQDGAVKAFDCWSDYETCVNNCENPLITNPADEPACSRSCLFNKAVCQNASWPQLPGPDGPPNGPNYCPQVYADRNTCAELYSGPENREAYWLCYGAIEHNEECPGYIQE